MDLNRISVFVKVVEARSFTAAAKALGLPKSSVSRSVSQLEDALGVRLLQRTTRTLHLTDAGQAYYETVARALVGIEEANAAAADLDKTPRGTIRMTAPVDVGTALLAEGFDLALRAGRLGDSSLVARRVGPSELALYASEPYLARRGAPKRVADLASHDCVVFRPTGERTRWVLNGPTGPEAVEVTGPVAADDFAFIVRAVEGGAGIGLLPSFLSAQCERGVVRSKLRRILPEHAVRGSYMHIVHPGSRYMPQRVALFRDFLCAELAKTPLNPAWGGAAALTSAP
jgi:DNA-binding transcriptional LysR family regulator